MTPELKKLELEQLRDELERHRIVLVEAYKIRKWLDCTNINDNNLLSFLRLISIEKMGYPWNSIKARYEADGSGFGRVAVILPSKVSAHVELAPPKSTLQKRNKSPSGIS